MKVAVIGAGKWGMNHVKTLHGLGVLAAIAEASEAQRNVALEACPGIEAFDSPGPIWESDCNAVTIATPGHTHYDIAKAALQAGKDVFLEKPMVLSSAHGEELVELAEAKGRVLMVGHLLIYQPAIRIMKQMIEAGDIGELVSLHQERLNLGRARSVENVFWSIGVHDVAVLLYLMGEAPTSVQAIEHKVLQPEIADDIYVHMAFRDGKMLAHMHASWLWPVQRRSLTAVGKDGMIVFDETGKTLTLHRKTIDQSLQNVDLGVQPIDLPEEPPLTLELQHFLDCVRTREAPRTDGRSALEVVRVMESVSTLEDGDANSSLIDELVSGESK